MAGLVAAVLINSGTNGRTMTKSSHKTGQINNNSNNNDDNNNNNISGNNNNGYGKIAAKDRYTHAKRTVTEGREITNTRKEVVRARVRVHEGRHVCARHRMSMAKRYAN